MKQAEIDMLCKMRAAGATFREIAAALNHPQGHVQYTYHDLPRDMRRMVDKHYTEVFLKMERERSRQRREVRKPPIIKSPISGPISSDADENDQLINQIFAGRKFESYQFKGG